MKEKLLNPLIRILNFFIVLYLVFATMNQTVVPFAPTDADNLRLGVALMADVHMEGNNLQRFQVTSRAMKNLGGGKDWLDALVLLGDNTMNGQDGEYALLYGMLERINPIRPYYLICGNHDVGNSADADYDLLIGRFTSFLQKHVDKNIDRAYYAKEVNGYRLIFLAPDNAEVNGRFFSDAQLDFLESELNKAKESGKPVFVFNHHPSSYVDDACYDRFIDLMNSYDKIFFIVGHMHYYWRFKTMPGEMDTPEIWVPNFGHLADDDGRIDEQSGRGYLMEVYDDSVSFRAFNYYTNTFYGVNDKTYSLTGDSDESIQPVPIDWPIDPPVYPPITPPIIVDPPVIVEPSGSETVG